MASPKPSGGTMEKGYADGRVTGRRNHRRYTGVHSLPQRCFLPGSICAGLTKRSQMGHTDKIMDITDVKIIPSKSDKRSTLQYYRYTGRKAP